MYSNILNLFEPYDINLKKNKIKFIDDIICKSRNFNFIDIDSNNYHLVKKKNKIKINIMMYLLSTHYKLNNKYEIEQLYNKNPLEHKNLIFQYLKENNFIEKEFNEVFDLLKIPFMSFNVINYILIYCNLKYVYVKDNLKLIFFSKKKLKKSLVNDIHNTIRFFNTIFPSTKSLELQIFFTPIKKQFITNEFTPNEINTGASDGFHIYLWREEEIIKVLFHELIHHYDLDLKHGCNYIGSRLKSLFNIEPDCHIKPNEAYTETCAIILYLIYEIIKNYQVFDYALFYKYLENEIRWSIYQSCKIINSFECFNKFSDLIKKDLNCKIKQKTSVISYFIIKTSLLFNLDKFIQLLEDNGQSSFKYINSNENYDNFYNTIIICLRNKKFNDLMNKIILTSKNIIIPSMKMCYYCN